MKIVPVETKKQLKQFVNFWFELYKECPYSCPPLLFDEYNTLRQDKNPAFEFSEAKYLMALDDSGKVVGRIAGIINHRANNYWKTKRLRFGWFDFIDDLNVSKALLDAIVEWGKSKGMDNINGPVGFTDMDKEGLLIDNFDKPTLMAAAYNYPYYEKHYLAYGLTKEIDWFERHLIVPDAIPERLTRIAAIVKERSNLRVVPVKSAKEVKKLVGYKFFDLVDECYRNLYNYSPLTQRQIVAYSNMYFPILNYDFSTLVLNDKNELVAVGVTMPNLTNVLREINGKLFPFGWFKLLRALKSKHYDEVDMLLIAVKPEYQGKGVNALLFDHQLPNFFKYGVKYGNVTNVLETNDKCAANWEFFELAYKKTHRAYSKLVNS
ncbi:MAG: N-acetyltransferase [Paludibacteraceae bacterium]|nr:N-acetyltransferase [Paludibacteraceae bacterium]